MGKCKDCGEETIRLYDGLCVPCLSVSASRNEQNKLDDENSLQGIKINTPIGNDMMSVFRVGQGNFGVKIPVNKEEPKEVKKDDLKVIKTEDYINIIYRPDIKDRFYGTIDLTKIDGDIYGVSGDNVWYFNRLFVPNQIRSKGVANKLLTELVKTLKDTGITLICEINPYGDLNEENLKELYLKFGFKETSEGYLIYKE